MNGYIFFLKSVYNITYCVKIIKHTQQLGTYVLYILQNNDACCAKPAGLKNKNTLIC